MLSYNNSVQGFLRAYSSQYEYDEIENKTLNQFKNEVKSLFLLMLRQNNSYFQVRIIDPNTGQELIKIVRTSDSIKVIDDSKLQNKAKQRLCPKSHRSNMEKYIYLKLI